MHKTALALAGSRVWGCTMTTLDSDLRGCSRDPCTARLILTPQPELCKWLWHVTRVCDIPWGATRHCGYLHLHVEVETLKHESLAALETAPLLVNSTSSRATCSGLRAHRISTPKSLGWQVGGNPSQKPVLSIPAGYGERCDTLITLSGRKAPLPQQTTDRRQLGNCQATMRRHILPGDHAKAYPARLPYPHVGPVSRCQKGFFHPGPASDIR